MSQNCGKMMDRGKPQFLTLGLLKVLNVIGLEISFFILSFNDCGFGCIHNRRFC